MSRLARMRIRELTTSKEQDFIAEPHLHAGTHGNPSVLHGHPLFAFLPRLVEQVLLQEHTI